MPKNAIFCGHLGLGDDVPHGVFARGVARDKVLAVGGEGTAPNGTLQLLGEDDVARAHVAHDEEVGVVAAGDLPPVGGEGDTFYAALVGGGRARAGGVAGECKRPRPRLVGENWRAHLLYRRALCLSPAPAADLVS